MKNDQKQSKNRRLPAFYIALSCCVIAIGAAGYISDSLLVSRTSTVSEVEEKPSPYPSPIPQITISPLPLPSAADISVFSENNPPEQLTAPEPAAEETSAQEDYIYDNPDAAEASALSETQISFAMPVEGEVLHPYSKEPYYNEVMRDWRTHNGADIESSEGTEVRCAADGEVKSVRSTICGTEICISHSGGYETIYSQLEAAPEISSGKNVRSGDVIGKITQSSGEPVSNPHLHFGMKKDGDFIDPLTALSE